MENYVFSALRAESEQLAVNKAEDHRLTAKLSGKKTNNKIMTEAVPPSLHPVSQESYETESRLLFSKNEREERGIQIEYIEDFNLLFHTHLPDILLQDKSCKA